MRDINTLDQHPRTKWKWFYLGGFVLVASAAVYAVAKDNGSAVGKIAFAIGTLLPLLGVGLAISITWAMAYLLFKSHLPRFRVFATLSVWSAVITFAISGCSSCVMEEQRQQLIQPAIPAQ